MQAETYLNRPFAEQREQVAPRRTKELLALAFVTVLTGGALFLPPSWDQAFTDICHLAAIFALATITVLWVTRMLGYAGIAVERLLVAIFLAGMPLVYIIAWFQMGRVGAGWLGIEVTGLPLYAGLAALGLQRSPWFLVLGIAGHGILWDAWHYFAKTGYIPRWYATGCFIVDVALSLYLATRIAAWRERGNGVTRSNQVGVIHD